MLCYEVLRKFVHRAFNPLLYPHDFGNRLDIYFGYIYICIVYIYVYIYVYGYVSIDNISYESPLTTNIPHDFETFLNVPLARHPRAELAWGLLPTLPQMSAVPDAAAPCEMVLSSSLAMSWWF